MTNPVSWFEIPAKDLLRAKKFYEKTFAFELSLQEMGPIKMAWFPADEKAAGATGSLVESQGYTPCSDGVLIYFNVDNIETLLEKVEQSGGKTLIPKQPIGPYGFFAHFEDSEGNRVGLHAKK